MLNLLSFRLLSQNVKTQIHITIILPVVLYGCETWLLTLREEGRLRVFEKRVLRRIFEPKRDKVTGEWRKLHNEELNDLYASPNFIWMIKSRMERARHRASMGERRDGYRVLVRKPEGKSALGRPKCRWENNIKRDLQEEGWRVVCTGLIWFRTVTDGWLL